MQVVHGRKLHGECFEFWRKAAGITQHCGGLYPQAGPRRPRRGLLDFAPTNLSSGQTRTRDPRGTSAGDLLVWPFGLQRFVPRWRKLVLLFSSVALG